MRLFTKALHELKTSKLVAIAMTMAMIITMLPLGTMEAKAAIKISDPVASVASGYYDSSFTITLTSETPGAVIYYTDDDSEFATNIWEVYTGPIAITVNTRIRAIAVPSGVGYEGSGIVEYTYNIGSAAAGYVYWGLECGSNVPMAVLTNSATSLKYAVTTTSEWNEIDKGSKLTVRVTIDNASSTISATDRALLQTNLGAATIAQYYNINIYKRMDLAGEAKVIKPNTGMNIIMVIPAEAFNTDITKTRVYSLLYVQDGTVVTTPVYKTTQGFLYYTAPRSTTYALVYQDIANVE